jgi:hypothetical protein
MLPHAEYRRGARRGVASGPRRDEQALRHHLQALQELPADNIVRPKLVITRKSGEALLKRVEKGKPTQALRDLMRDRA